MSNAPPSKNPADDGSLAGALNTVLRKFAQQTECMLPARVIEYDRERNVATVQPLVQVLTTSGEAVSRAQIAEVPVLALGGGGWALSFPLQPGDLGWIEASDRDISLYMQSLGEAPPNTYRLHSFSDGRFVPDAMRQFDASSVSPNAMSIQSLDGSTRVDISPGQVRIEAVSVIATGSVTAEGNLSAGTGASGTFTTPLGQVVTVDRGIVTNIT